MKTRLESLDVFRGATVMLMILVNTPGSWSHIYPPLEHSKWHGCTPTDLVFPFFLFIVGVSMSFSFKKFGFRLNDKSIIKILKRGLILFAISWGLRAFPFNSIQPATFRYLGVLPRIALAYVFSSFIVLLSSRRTIWIVFISILMLYWGLLWAYGNYTLEGNFALQFDLKVLGEAHMYHGFGIAFDPEGLLSTLPSIGTVLLGYLTGTYIKQFAKDSKIINYLLFLGIVLVIIGKVWDIFLPINKPLWTSSYVVYTGGIAIVLLIALYYIVDIRKSKFWIKPFLIYGRNPLFGFVLSILFVKILWKVIKLPSGQTGYSYLYKSIFVPILGELNGSLAFAIVYVVLIGLILWYMDKKKIYIKI